MRRLIVTADDFGLCSEVNHAVVKAHQDGILTCASLMVAAPAAEEAVLLAQRYPTLKVGLHLVLTNGKSILPHNEIPDLANEKGEFSNDLLTAGLRYFFLKKLRVQLRKECEAQIATFFKSGIRLDHLNCHNHFHIHPTIQDILLPLAQRYRIKAIRQPLPSVNAFKFRQILTFLIVAPWAIRLRGKLKQAGIAYNQEIVGLFETGAMTLDAWLRLIPQFNNCVTEAYCHPAVEQTDFLKTLMPDYKPLEEFQALLSRQTRQALESRQIKTSCFEEII